MATVAPTTAAGEGYLKVTWTGVSTADTMTAYGPVNNRAGSFGSVMMTGTWGSATVTLAASEDGTTYLTAKDRNNTAVSATSNARFELSSSAVYFKPTSSGGTADNVDVVLILRGQ